MMKVNSASTPVQNQHQLTSDFNTVGQNMLNVNLNQNQPRPGRI